MKNLLKFISICLIFVLISCSDEVTSPPDIMPPVTPTNFRLLGGGDGQVHLRWDASQELDFKNYTIYRTTDLETPFAPIVSLTANEYVDQFLSYDLTYYYHVTASDYAGNESDPSDYIDIKPMNISSPTRPRDLQVYGHNLPIINDVAVHLYWTPNEEGDLDAYFIYRDTIPDLTVSDTTFIGTSPIASYRDEAVMVGIRYYYRVQAVDRGGKESIPSHANDDILLPQVRLISPANGVMVSLPFEFRWRSLEHAAGYRVIVSRSPFSEEIWVTELLPETTTTIGYAGPQLQSGWSYYWWVAAYSKVPDEDEDELSLEINSQSEYMRFMVRPPDK